MPEIIIIIFNFLNFFMYSIVDRIYFFQFDKSCFCISVFVLFKKPKKEEKGERKKTTCAHGVYVVHLS